MNKSNHLYRERKAFLRDYLVISIFVLFVMVSLQVQPVIPFSSIFILIAFVPKLMGL